jgi:hypothetical protein
MAVSAWWHGNKSASHMDLAVQESKISAYSGWPCECAGSGNGEPTRNDHGRGYQS